MGIVKAVAEKFGLSTKEVKRRIMKYGIKRAKEIYKAKGVRSREAWYDALRQGLREAWSYVKRGELPPAV